MTQKEDKDVRLAIAVRRAAERVAMIRIDHNVPDKKADEAIMKVAEVDAELGILFAEAVEAAYAEMIKSYV